jgi:hypothetical protein
MSDDIRVGHLVTPELLTALDKVFPLLPARLSDSERLIFLRSGHREVVDFLKNQYERRIAQAAGDE